MVILAFYYHLPLFGQQDYIVTVNNDTIKGEIEFNNRVNSLSSVVIKTSDTTLVFSTDSLNYYQRAGIRYIRLSHIVDSLVYSRFYKEEVNGHPFQVYSYLYNGEIQYRIQKDGKLAPYFLIQKRWRSKLSRYLRKYPDLALKIKQKELSFESVPDIFRNANNPNFLALSQAEVYGKRIRKIPIYRGEDPNPRRIVKTEGIAGNGKKGKVASAGSAGGSGPTDENSWFFYNFGVNTGLQYFNANYHDNIVPIGNSYGYEADLAFFQLRFWTGWQTNHTFYPYLNKGNATITSKGWYARQFIGPFFYVHFGYNTISHRFNSYPPGQGDVPCSNVVSNGLEDYDTLFGAFKLFKTIDDNTFEFAIGVHTKDLGMPVWLPFNHFQLSYTQFVINNRVNETNYNYVEERGRTVPLVEGNSPAWIISLQIGWRLWWEPYR